VTGVELGESHRLQFPLSATEARQLRAGDQVLMDGEIIITAGLPTHERLLTCLDGHESLPLDLREASVFHLGSYLRETVGGHELVYLNPTTSTRFNPMMPRLIHEFGWHAVGGKGGLDAASAAALQAVGGVYLGFLGGGCTLLTQAVREVLQVGWTDMLMHYRLVRLRVEALGPVTVGIDAHGRSLYTERRLHAEGQRDRIAAALGGPGSAR
jgi:fumarate hydratase subunit beta